MAASYGVQRPTNKIVAAGTPLVQELSVETATNMYPGRLVKTGTDSDEVVVNDAATNTTVVGWLGYEHTNPNYRKADTTTTYAEGDQVAVLNGGKFVILADALGATPKGTPLTGGAGGKVTAMSYADMSLNIHVGYAEDVSSNGKVLVRSMI